MSIIGFQEWLKAAHRGGNFWDRHSAKAGWEAGMAEADRRLQPIRDLVLVAETAAFKSPWRDVVGIIDLKAALAKLEESLRVKS